MDMLYFLIVFSILIVVIVLIVKMNFKGVFLKEVNLDFRIFKINIKNEQIKRPGEGTPDQEQMK